MITHAAVLQAKCIQDQGGLTSPRAAPQIVVQRWLQDGTGLIRDGTGLIPLYSGKGMSSRKFVWSFSLNCKAPLVEVKTICPKHGGGMFSRFNCIYIYI